MVLYPGLVCLILAIGPAVALADTRQDCERHNFEYAREDIDLKIRACTKIIDRDGKAAWAYINRGLAYDQKYDHDRAIADHSKAIEIDPRSAGAYHYRGHAYKERLLSKSDDGDFDRAIADYTKAIEIEPRANFYDSRASIYSLRLRVYEIIRDRDRAIDYRHRVIADYTKAIQIEPNAYRYWSRAHNYETLGRTAEAIADYWEAVALNADDSLSWKRLKELVPQAAKRDAATALPPAAAPSPPKVVESAGGTLSPSRAAVPLTPAEERTLVPKDSFKECDACPEMVVVPAGEFIMGSPVSEAGRAVAEGPQRRVTITRPFAVGKFEVTFAEWDACVAAGGCRHRPGDEGWGRARRPVINVTWKDIADEYLPWLTRATGKNYRLLREAEWEYAARAGTVTSYAFGDTISAKQAQFSEGKVGSARKTAEVGSFQPNSFGLYDMHGNVWEWVEDTWHAYHRAPIDGTAVSRSHYDQVMRGGSWIDPPNLLRSAARSKAIGNMPGRLYVYVGFRVARALSP